MLKLYLVVPDATSGALSESLYGSVASLLVVTEDLAVVLSDPLMLDVTHHDNNCVAAVDRYFVIFLSASRAQSVLPLPLMVAASLVGH